MSELSMHVDARRFKAGGVLWRVYEARDVSGTSLVFECWRIARRVRGFPLNWRELTDPDLELLSWSR